MLGPMLPLALATSLAVLVAGGGALPPPAPLAVVRVPDEPGAIVLPDSQPTVQAVAADLDGDGAPELVRLMGGRSGPLYVEAYRETGGSWAPAASRITAVPGAAGLGEAAYARRPARLLLRQVSGRDRVTLVRPARRSPSRRTSANAASSSMTSSSTVRRSESSRSPIHPPSPMRCTPSISTATGPMSSSPRTSSPRSTMPAA